jgi:putative glutamine amidotransferase
MNVLFASRTLSQAVAEKLSKHNIFFSENRDRKTTYDLVIFTGGSDIHPEAYGERVNGAVGFDTDRDSHELALLQDIYGGYIKVRKLLGICRGMQMLHVARGGRLIQHIPNAHRSYHTLKWLEHGPLDTFAMVNSLHHQCIIPDGRQRVLAMHEDGDPEATYFSYNGIEQLGVQWHPEWMTNAEDFFDIIIKWVNGGTIVK